MNTRTIITEHIYPPIPIRSHDWCAWIEGEDEETRAQGYGATRDEAVANLMANLEDDQ